jgi:hypothetical protein
MNLWTTCGEDFTPDGRRRFTVSELEERRWFRDRFGRWSDPRRQRSRESLEALAQSRQKGSSGVAEYGRMPSADNETPAATVQPGTAHRVKRIRNRRAETGEFGGGRR